MVSKKRGLTVTFARPQDGERAFVKKASTHAHRGQIPIDSNPRRGRSRFGDWQVTWVGGWTRHHLTYWVMLSKLPPSKLTRLANFDIR
jgi:hypothetical protein